MQLILCLTLIKLFMFYNLKTQNYLPVMYSRKQFE